MKASVFIVLSLSLGLSSLACAAPTYTWVDDSGNRSYSDRPPPGVNAQKVDSMGRLVSFVGGNDASEDDEGEATTSNQEEAQDSFLEDPESAGQVDETVIIVEEEFPPTDEDTETAAESAIISVDEQESYCTAAKNNKVSLQHGGIVRQKQQDGDLRVLSPAEKQKELEVTEEIIAAYCRE